MLTAFKTAVVSEVSILKLVDGVFKVWHKELQTMNISTALMSYLVIQLFIALIIFDIPYTLGHFNPYISTFSLEELVYYFFVIPILFMYFIHVIFFFTKRPRLVPWIITHFAFLFSFCVMMLFWYIGMRASCSIGKPNMTHVSYKDCYRQWPEVFFSLLENIMISFFAIPYYIFTHEYFIPLIFLCVGICIMYQIAIVLVGIFKKYRQIRFIAQSKKSPIEDYDDVIVIDQDI